MDARIKQSMNVFRQKEQEALDTVACMQMLQRAVPYLCSLPGVGLSHVNSLAAHCAACTLSEAIATIRVWVRKRWSDDEIPQELLSLLEGNTFRGVWAVSESVDVNLNFDTRIIPPQWSDSP